MNTTEREFLKQLGNVGPAPGDYQPFSEILARTFERGVDAKSDVDEIRSALAVSLGLDTLQGFALRKPHGYPGDFEIIDHIYLEHCAEEPRCRRWDQYFHAQAATRAVRNRKSYFHRILDQLNEGVSGLIRVLNVASGPCRCVHQWLSAHPESNIRFDCIDNDQEALRYAATLNAEYLDRVMLAYGNALKTELTHRYHLIWVAGLCDYLSDSRMVSLVRRLSTALVPGAELVLGNFGDFNPTRPYMEIVGDWRLTHRSADSLLILARGAGIDLVNAKIGAEQEGVNLFLHVTNR